MLLRARRRDAATLACFDMELQPPLALGMYCGAAAQVTYGVEMALPSLEKRRDAVKDNHWTTLREMVTLLSASVQKLGLQTPVLASLS